MFFPDKMKLLMELFKISNSQLARAINVDASLISRWKSGQRQVSASSPHLPALAHYFTKYHGYQYQQEMLNQLLQIHTSDSQVRSEDQKIQLLTEWLTSDQMPKPLDHAKQFSHLSRSEQLITGISKILSASPANLEISKPDPEIMANTVLINQFNDKLKSITADRLKQQVAMENQKTQAHKSQRTDHVTVSTADDISNPTEAAQTASVYKYKGHAGRRKAVLHFLYHLLRQPEPKNVFLFSEESMDWLLKDRAFTFLWANLLMEIIKCGHQISIIHVVDRELNEMIKMLQYWMPLHLSGQIQSYYMPHYTEKKIKQTQFIIENELALISNIQSDNRSENFHQNKDHYLTIVYDDAEIIATHQLVFRARLDESKQLFVLYQKIFAARLFEDAKHYLLKSGTLYSIHDQLNIFTLPQTLIKEIEDELYSLTDKGRYLPLLYEYFRLSRDHLNSETCIQIYPVSLLNEIAANKHATFMSSELFMKKPVALTRRQTLVWLRSIIELLERNENYHVMFVPDLPGLNDVNVNISYKKYVSAFFSSNYQSGEMMIRLDETNILHALSYFFDSLADNIPESLKLKKHVISRLTNLIDLLSDHKSHRNNSVSSRNRLK